MKLCPTFLAAMIEVIFISLTTAIKGVGLNRTDAFILTTIALYMMNDPEAKDACQKVLADRSPVIAKVWDRLYDVTVLSNNKFNDRDKYDVNKFLEQFK